MSKLRAFAYGASIAVIEVPYNKGYDLTEVKNYFIAKGIPGDLASIILKAPRGGDVAAGNNLVSWAERHSGGKPVLIIEVTFRGEASGHFYLGEI